MKMKRRDFLATVVPTVGLGKTWLEGLAISQTAFPLQARAGALPFPEAAKEVSSEIWLQEALKDSLPQGAEPRGGDWRVRDGRLVQARYGGPSLLVMGEPDWNNYTATVRVRFPAPAKGTEAGLALHIRANGDYVVFSLKNKKGGLFAVLRIESSAGMTIYAAALYLKGVTRTTFVGDQCLLPVDPGSWHELRADVHGTEFYCSVDGRHVADYDFKAELPSWHAQCGMWSPDPATEPPSEYCVGALWSAGPDQGKMGLISLGWPAEFQQLEVRRLPDYSHISTPMKGRRDVAGKLLPRQSYSETMRRITEWVIHCDEVVEKDMAPPSLQHLYPPVLAIRVFSDNEGLIFDVGDFALSAGVFLSGAVQYYLYSGETRIVAKAEELADWSLANSTPADWALPFLPPSIVQWQPDGSWKGLSAETWGLEPDKSAYLGEAYLRLYAATGKTRYLEGARRIARTLSKLRQPDGNWPFRINPQTGHIIYPYTQSQLWYIRFFERLARLTGERDWLKLRDGALRWMLENPVKTSRWQGLYGDIASGTESYDQWVPLEFAQYLVDHREGHPEYVGVALKILDWVYKTLVVTPGLLPGVPGVFEQTSLRVVLTHHELRLAQTHAVLWGATRDPKHKDAALNIANSVTWLLMSDGKMRMSLWYFAADCHIRCLTFYDQFTRIMAEIPEAAPRDENHLLEASSDVRDIRYGDGDIYYETLGASSDILVVRGAPRVVKAGGMALQERTEPTELGGWSYDRETHRLEVRHQGPNVEILF